MLECINIFCRLALKKSSSTMAGTSATVIKANNKSTHDFICVFCRCGLALGDRFGLLLGRRARDRRRLPPPAPRGPAALVGMRACLVVGTALRAVRSSNEIHRSIGPTAGSESPPYLQPSGVNPSTTSQRAESSPALDPLSGSKDNDTLSRCLASLMPL